MYTYNFYVIELISQNVKFNHTFISYKIEKMVLFKLGTSEKMYHKRFNILN